MGQSHMSDTAPFPVAPALADALRSADRVVALTGAGVSAESGVPTFRDAQSGLWAKFDPLELATPGAFERQPRLVWDWYGWRRELVARSRPNAAHVALAKIERRVPDFLLVTQNVDGLHAAAGSRNLVELHGNIARVRCSREGTPVSAWQDSDPQWPPRCPGCGAFLRPDVVWFEEALPAGALARADHAVANADVLLVIGTSAEVYPAAALPLRARDAGALIVEINPASTPLTAIADHALHGRAGDIVPALVAATWPADGPSRTDS